MAPRGFTLPSAKTESAKAARSAFFCSLCQKGYSRQNEYEAHESSYDHQHKKRLKEMKEMQKQAQPKAKEDKGPLISVKLGSGTNKTSGAGFKKGGFKNAFGAASQNTEEDDKVIKKEEDQQPRDIAMKDAMDDMKPDDDNESDFTDDDDYYDPARPTGCTPNCPGRLAFGAT